MKNGVRSLATKRKAPNGYPVDIRNRYSVLELEEPTLQADSEDVAEQESHVSNVDIAVQDTELPLEHDLLRVEGRINGRRAIMLIDSGSTHDFISEAFVQRNGLVTESKDETLKVTLADGSSTSSGLQRTGPVKVIVKDFSDTQSFTVFPLSRYDAILGKPWLTRHNPDINFQTNEVKLNGEPLVAKPPSGQNSDTERQESPPIESMLISGSQARREFRKGAQGILAWVNATDDEEEDSKPSAARQHISHAGAILWNQLPDTARLERKRSTFKSLSLAFLLGSTVN